MHTPTYELDQIGNAKAASSIESSMTVNHFDNDVDNKSLVREMIDLLKNQLHVKDQQLQEQGEQIKETHELNLKLTGTMLQQSQKIENLLRLSVAALALSALAWIILTFIKATKIHGNIRNCRFGLRGEQAVAEALADGAVVTAGYVAFHDVPGDGAWNVDHIVVGPGGIFVLETKTRSRRKPTREQPDHEVWFDGQSLQFPWCTDRDAALQAERNAEWVRHFFSGFGPEEILVHPVIVIPGWYVKTQGKHAVKPMNAKYLSTGYLPSFERRFSPQQLLPVIRRLDERCRDLEF